MIRSARKRHRAMIVTLAVVAPLLFLAGLSVRQSVPAVQDPTVRKDASGRGDLESLREEAAPGELPIRVAWLRETGTGRMVGLELTGPLKRPDLLVYWDDLPAADGALSDEARLLGRAGDRLHVVWEVPTPDASGRLVFYSTAWNEVVGSLSPPTEWGITP